VVEHNFTENMNPTENELLKEKEEITGINDLSP
jgi:hypothetical protein